MGRVQAGLVKIGPGEVFTFSCLGILSCGACLGLSWLVRLVEGLKTLSLAEGQNLLFLRGSFPKEAAKSDFVP